MRRMQALGLGVLLCATPVASSLAQGKGATATTPQSPPPAKTLIASAVKTAKANNKAVFVHFGASWCGYCHKLEKFLDSTEAGRIMAAHYVVVSLTALEQGDKRVLENPGADSMLMAAGVDGLPGFFILDADGKQIASSMVMPPNGGNMGYPATPEEVKTFGELLQKTAPRMTEDDRAKIITYLAEVGKSITSH